jgi:hypothetical protein
LIPKPVALSAHGRGRASIHEPGVSAPGSRSLRELKASGSIRTVRGLCRASRTVAICPLRGARAAWRLTWPAVVVSVENPPVGHGKPSLEEYHYGIV